MMMFRCTEVIFPYTGETCFWNNTKKILVGEVQRKIFNAMNKNCSIGDNC